MITKFTAKLGMVFYSEVLILKEEYSVLSVNHQNMNSTNVNRCSIKQIEKRLLKDIYSKTLNKERKSKEVKLRLMFMLLRIKI